MFRLIFNYSGKQENKTVEEIKKNLAYTFNYYKVKKDAQTFKLIKSEWFGDVWKIF